MTAKKATTRKRAPKNPTCYAYFESSPGNVVRCGDDAGHRGRHTYSLSWNDSQSFDPTSSAAAPVEVVPAPARLTAVPTPPEADVDAVAAAARGEEEVPKIPQNKRCADCKHAWHGEMECVAVARGPEGLMPCGCLNAIE